MSRDDVIAHWAHSPLRELTICFLVAGESGQESESHDVKERYTLQMHCLAAMGKYRFGELAWKDELEATFARYGKGTL